MIQEADNRVGSWHTVTDLFFPENQLPRTTPEETRILAVRAEPYRDAARLRVVVELTPFRKRPYLDFVVSNAEGIDLASVTIVEPSTWKLEFTMHLRGQLCNPHTLEAWLYYPDGPTFQHELATFEMTESNS